MTIKLSIEATYEEVEVRSLASGDWIVSGHGELCRVDLVDKPRIDLWVVRFVGSGSGIYFPSSVVHRLVPTPP